MKLLHAFLLAVSIALLLNYLKEKKQIQVKQAVQHKPDDLFSDGLDHNMGLNKKNRHHSF